MKVNNGMNYRVTFELAGYVSGTGTYRTKRQAVSAARKLVMNHNSQMVEVTVRSHEASSFAPIIGSATVEKWNSTGNWSEWMPILSTSYNMEFDFRFRCRCG